MEHLFNLQQRETLAVYRDWQQLYVPAGEAKRRGVSLQYLWHTFSYGLYPSIRGAAATAEHLAALETEREVYVLDASGRGIAAGRIPRLRPDLLGWT